MRLASPVVVVVLALAGCGESLEAAPTTTAPRAPEVTIAPAVEVTTAPPTEAPAPPTTATAVPAGRDTTVERVVDGDTIVVAGGERVRLIGIDTPETKDPRKPVQCFGKEASAYTESLLPPGTAVRLVADVEATDRFGRSLAYVYRADDGLFVNAALARDGYAVTATYPPNVAHVDELAALAREAREAGRGLWSACGEDTPPTTAAPVAPQPAAGSGCDPSYPDHCIPPSPPDLDCGTIKHRRFRVLPPDPHRFDGNHDGVGCES